MQSILIRTNSRLGNPSYYFELQCNNFKSTIVQLQSCSARNERRESSFDFAQAPFNP